jgi:hypothetical protein
MRQSTEIERTKGTADEELPVIARFEVRRRGYLAPDGTVQGRLPGFASDTALLVSLYRGIVLTRAFDLKAVSLQRTGRLGTYAVSLGQEAVSVGIASAMREEDVVLLSPTASRSDRRLRTPRASPMRSRSETSCGLRSACSATAPPPRVTSKACEFRELVGRRLSCENPSLWHFVRRLHFTWSEHAVSAQGAIPTLRETAGGTCSTRSNRPPTSPPGESTSKITPRTDGSSMADAIASPISAYETSPLAAAR